MYPRKKRVRYIGVASSIAKEKGIDFDRNNWEQIWSLLDKYGEPTYVYAIVDSGSSLVKFGRSVNPMQRLSALKTGNARDLNLLAFCKESVDICEKIIHKEVKEHRVSGEWFRLNCETRKLIEKIRNTGLGKNNVNSHTKEK